MATPAWFLERYASGDRDSSGCALAGADLEGIDLAGANLREAHLSGARLRRANLEGADITEAFLIHTDLVEAKLSRARLVGARLDEARLDGASLVNANLQNVRADGASFGPLSKAVFDGCRIGDTVLTGVDLGGLCRVSDLGVRGPCPTDWLSVVRSLNEPRLKDLLRSLGTPWFARRNHSPDPDCSTSSRRPFDGKHEMAAPLVCFR